MPTRLSELAAMVSGVVLGDGDFPITGAAPLQDARPGEISLLDTAEHAGRLAHTAGSAVVVPKNFTPPESWPAIQVDNVHAAFITLLLHFRPERVRVRHGVSGLAALGNRVILSRDVDVHPFATIEDDVEVGAGSTIHAGVHLLAGCKIGANVTIYPNAVLYEGTIVGDRCIIHAGVVLGADGFGYRQRDGKHVKSAQLGHVEIAADVEIGPNTTIDRGTYGATYVGEGTKIDNLVQIGHNCRIGRHNLLCAQVGMAGSTTTGDYVVMAGQTGLADHIHIGSGAVLGARCGVTKDVPEGARMLGAPAMPERDQKLLIANLSRLPEMRRELRDLHRLFANQNGTPGRADQT